MKLLAMLACAAAASLCGQTLSAKWEELTAADFEQAIQKARGTCLLPFGIIEPGGGPGLKEFDEGSDIAKRFLQIVAGNVGEMLQVLIGTAKRLVDFLQLPVLPQ